MTTKHGKTLTLAIGALIGTAGAAQAAPQFALVDLGAGYMLAAGGEGKCGHAAMDTNKDGKITRAEHTAHHDAMFTSADTNKDGSIDQAEMAAHKKAHHEGKCGEGKCGEGKCGGEKGKEGKCGEGKCGGEKGKEGSCGGSA